jgi:hypothetical protein
MISDIAIDDIQFTPGSCTGKLLIRIELELNALKLNLFVLLFVRRYDRLKRISDHALLNDENDGLF